MRPSRLLALGMLVSTLGLGGSALAGDPVELILTEKGGETPWLTYGDEVTVVIPDLEKATVVEVPDGLFVGQSGKEVTVEPGGSTYTVDKVDDGSYPVVTVSYLTTPLIGTINVSSTKKPR